MNKNNLVLRRRLDLIKWEISSVIFSWSKPLSLTGFLSKLSSLNGMDLVSLFWLRVIQRSTFCQILNTNVCVCNEMYELMMLNAKLKLLDFACHQRTVESSNLSNSCPLRFLLYCQMPYFGRNFKFRLVFIAPLSGEAFDLFFI